MELYKNASLSCLVSRIDEGRPVSESEFAHVADSDTASLFSFCSFKKANSTLSDRIETFTGHKACDVTVKVFYKQEEYSTLGEEEIMVLERRVMKGIEICGHDYVPFSISRSQLMEGSATFIRKDLATKELLAYVLCGAANDIIAGESLVATKMFERIDSTSSKSVIEQPEFAQWVNDGWAQVISTPTVKFTVDCRYRDDKKLVDGEKELHIEFGDGQCVASTFMIALLSERYGLLTSDEGRLLMDVIKHPMFNFYDVMDGSSLYVEESKQKAFQKKWKKCFTIFQLRPFKGSVVHIPLESINNYSDEWVDYKECHLLINDSTLKVDKECAIEGFELRIASKFKTGNKKDDFTNFGYQFVLASQIRPADLSLEDVGLSVENKRRKFAQGMSMAAEQARQNPMMSMSPYYRAKEISHIQENQFKGLTLGGDVSSRGVAVADWIGLFTGQWTLKDGEVFAPGYGDGKELALYRSPMTHRTSIGRTENKFIREYAHLAGCTIIPARSAIAAIMDGMDFDIDDFLIVARTSSTEFIFKNMTNEDPILDLSVDKKSKRPEKFTLENMQRHIAKCLLEGSSPIVGISTDIATVCAEIYNTYNGISKYAKEIERIDEIGGLMKCIQNEAIDNKITSVEANRLIKELKTELFNQIKKAGLNISFNPDKHFKASWAYKEGVLKSNPVHVKGSTMNRILECQNDLIKNLVDLALEDVENGDFAHLLISSIDIPKSEREFVYSLVEQFSVDVRDAVKTMTDDLKEKLRRDGKSEKDIAKVTGSLFALEACKVVSEDWRNRDIPYTSPRFALTALRACVIKSKTRVENNGVDSLGIGFSFVNFLCKDALTKALSLLSNYRHMGVGVTWRQSGRFAISSDFKIVCDKGGLFDGRTSNEPSTRIWYSPVVAKQMLQECDYSESSIVELEVKDLTVGDVFEGNEVLSNMGGGKYIVKKTDAQDSYGGHDASCDEDYVPDYDDAYETTQAVVVSGASVTKEKGNKRKPKKVVKNASEAYNAALEEELKMAYGSGDSTSYDQAIGQDVDPLSDYDLD